MKKTLVILAVILGAYNFASGAFYGNMVEEDAYLSASSAFEKSDYDGAAAQYSAFLEKFPESKYKAASLLKLAELSENTEDAQKYYNKVINEFPGKESEAEAVYDLAKLFYAQDDYKKAAVYFNIVTAKFPSMIWVEESYYMLLLCALAGHDTAVFEKTLDEYKTKGFFTFNTRVDFVYAGYLFDTGKYDKALALYKELIDKTQGKDKNIYMPVIYLNAAEAAKRIGDLTDSDRMESDLKYKYPDSLEARGNKVSAAPTQAATMEQMQTIKIPADKDETREFYTVQIGAYSNKRFCDLTAAKLKKDKYDVFEKKDGKFYKLSVGRFKTREEADAFAPALAKKEKLKTYLVKQGWE